MEKLLTVLGSIGFALFMIGGAGIEDMNGEFQIVAIIMMFVGLAMLVIVGKVWEMYNF